MDFHSLIGKQIIALRGYKQGNGKVSLHYILFDDRKTFLLLNGQDRYDYHDCDHSARVLTLVEDPKQWADKFDCKQGVEPFVGDGYYPF